MTYLYLTIAIVAEVVGTSALNATEEFSKLVPSVVVAVSYCISFYFLTLALRSIPLGVAYATWSGLGIVLVAVAGIFLYKQVPDLPAVIGMSLIISGVAIIHLFSKTVNH